MSSASTEHRPVVTIAALYGAGGTVIGPKVAERLGVRCLNREIPESVAKRTGLPEQAVSEVDQKPQSRMNRLFASLGRASGVFGTAGPAERLDLQERQLRAYIEEFLAQATVQGGVAIGRGGMIVLREVPWALHVHLGGPREARLRQRTALEGIDRQTAERRQKAEDGARMRYVRRAYGIDGGDPSLYHLMLDSTAIDLDTCVDLIVTAAQAHTRHKGDPGDLMKGKAPRANPGVPGSKGAPTGRRPV